MPRYIGMAFVLLAFCIGATLRPNIAADPPKDEKKESPIPIEEVWRRGILGQLGHPLGTIVTIEGEVADENYRRMKIDSGKRLLRVQMVNDAKLKSEDIFHFSPFADEIADKPKVGAKFKYRGYETGRFDGNIEGSEKYIGAFPGVNYGFQTQFVILKDELKEK